MSEEKKTETEKEPEKTETAEVDEIDELMKEFEAAKTAEPPPQTTVQPKTQEGSGDDTTARLEALELVQQQRDFSTVIQDIKGDTEIDDELAEGFVRTRAAKDHRIEQAFQQRMINPEQWSQTQKALKKEFTKRYGSIANIDAGVTEDKAAVRAAAKSQHSQPEGDFPTDDQIRDMPAEDFAKLQEKLGVRPNRF